MRAVIISISLCTCLWGWCGCGDGDLASSGGYCSKWCRACALCSDLNIQEGDCLDNGGPLCRSRCDQALADPEEGCRVALDRHGSQLTEVIAAPGWLGCKTTVDRENPFDSSACPALSP